MVQGMRPGYNENTTRDYRNLVPVNPSYPREMEIDTMKKEKRCFNCQKIGYYARNCRSGGPRQFQPRGNGRSGPPRQIKTASREETPEDEKVHPKQNELEWVRKNPLNQQCYHICFIRSSDGALYQKFLSKE